MDEQVARIDAEWTVLGRALYLGDIVWFIDPSGLSDKSFDIVVGGADCGLAGIWT